MTFYGPWNFTFFLFWENFIFRMSKHFFDNPPYVQQEGKIACNDQGRVLGRVAKTFTSWESQCTSDDYSTPGHVFLKVYYYHHGMHIFPATFWLLSTLPGSDDCAFQRFSQCPDKTIKINRNIILFPFCPQKFKLGTIHEDKGNFFQK